MPRIDEDSAAKEFVSAFLGGQYHLERSKNSEVNYSQEKEPRDTDAVKEFVKSKLFATLENM